MRTLPRGNAWRDAPRHKTAPRCIIQDRTQSVQNGMRRRASHDTWARESSPSAGYALCLVEEGPGHEAALFLTLAHFHDLHFKRAGFFQGALDRGQVGCFGHQGTEPHHLTR
ncbi:DUF1534 domain-containing protein [Pseudomonas cannabina]|nr:DUF1534 domain-containing protein [Pseudomonas cannabina]